MLEQGAAVAKWLESLAPYRCEFESHQVYRILLWRGYPASLRNVSGSSQVPACVWI